MTQVAVVDSGGANIGSIRFALERLNVASVLTCDAGTIEAADRVILPGVGAAADAMARLSDAGLTALIPKLEQPVLAICLGMHLLGRHSEEGDTPCLGILDSRAARLPVTADTPVPNMGWCRVAWQTPHDYFADIASGSWFYFAHSFALPVTAETLATAEHANALAAVAARGNFFATQFHPERSGRAGTQLIKNFVEGSPCN